MHIKQTDTLYNEACAFFRSAWDGQPVTELQETFILAAHPVSIALILLSGVALWRANLWLALGTSLLLAIWAVHIATGDMLNDARFSAQEVGCIGHSTLFITLILALCAAVTLYTAYVRVTRTLGRRHR